mmetsp:Transcript_444/g.686  ORF Transcript_444/g.686 Transcript_444/m.686 type:complete len:84 (+) Transcript_444:27-278(+)
MMLLCSAAVRPLAVLASLCVIVGWCEYGRTDRAALAELTIRPYNCCAASMDAKRVPKCAISRIMVDLFQFDTAAMVIDCTLCG